MVSENKKLGVSASLSLVGHALVAVLLLLAPSTAVLDLQRADEIAIEIQEETPRPPPALVVTAPDTPPVARLVPRARTVQDIGAIAETSPQLAPTTPLVALPSAMFPSTEPQHTVIVPREQLHQLLDPTRVAAADALYDATGPSQPGPPATLHPESPDQGPSAEEAVAMAQEYLGAAAAAKTYITRREFHLSQQTDGSYRYHGHAFDAVIHPDGSVGFTDRPGFDVDLAHGSAGFDITDAIMGSAGQDPYAAEREFFMERAEETIARLESRARTEAATHSLSGVRTRCRTIWEDATMPAAARRRALFDLWDELADGDEGAPARQAVVAYIRSAIPSSSAESFTMMELARMNANRQSAERFDPYP